MSIKEKAIKGGLWNAFERIGTALFLFLSYLILARLLSPDDFGSIAMIYIFVDLSNSLVEGGFCSALIQKKYASQTDFSTIFYWNIILAVLLYFLLYFLSPAIASFYHMGELSLILRVLGIILFFNALCFVQISRLKKNLQFRILAKGNLFAMFIGTTIAIYFAYRGLGVWSLVAKSIFTSIVACLVFWIISDWRPLKVFSFSSLRNLFNFGGFMFLSSLSNTFYSNFVSLVLGKNYTPSSLGYFTQARKIEDVPRQILSSIINNVSFPVLSTLNDNSEKMRKAIMISFNLLCYICFPICAFFFLVSKPLVIFLLSEKWAPAIPILQLLCFYSLIASVVDFEQQILKSTGKSNLLFITGLFRKGIGLLLIIAGLKGGLYGVIWAFVISEYIGYIIITYPLHHLVQYGIWNQIKCMIPYAMIATISVFSTHYISVFLDFTKEWIILFSDFVLFIVSYIFLGYLFKVEGYVIIIDIIPNKWHRSFWKQRLGE